MATSQRRVPNIAPNGKDATHRETCTQLTRKPGEAQYNGTMKLFRLLVAGALIAIAGTAPKTAIAQDSQEPSRMQQALAFAQNIPWQGIGMSALDRARRSVALGPYVGLAGTGGKNQDLDAALSFGLGLSRFAIPIAPDRAEIEGVLKDRFVKLFLEKLDQAMKGSLDGSNVHPKQIAKDVWNDILQGYLEGRRHRMLEDPGFRIHVEGTRLFAADAWQARATVGTGVLGVAVGLSFGGHFGDANYAFIGLEAAKPLVFGTARTPVVDILGRVDRGFGEDHDDLSFSLGARLLLDVL